MEKLANIGKRVYLCLKITKYMKKFAPYYGLTLIIIGVVSFLFSLIGYQLGARFGRSIAHRLKPELLGGVILIGIGVKILAEHLFS